MPPYNILLLCRFEELIAECLIDPLDTQKDTALTATKKVQEGKDRRFQPLRGERIEHRLEKEKSP